jgi:outer membrane protein TolC
MNAKRIETTRLARELAEQRLDVEQKRFEVGMSISFLVIQAQRDLAEARQHELAAVLAYNLALVDFDALQQAGPAGQAPAALTVQTPVPTSAAASPPVVQTSGGNAALGLPN